MSLKDIGIGWGRWLKLLSVSEKIKKESERRLIICDGCEHGIPSKFLEFLDKGAENVHGKYCNVCKCPCHQKSLTDEVCLLGKWDINNDLKQITVK